MATAAPRRVSAIGRIAVGAIARHFARDVRMRVVGVEHVPLEGPAIVAARHYHHLYDGVALVRALPRTPHIFVALDWTRTPIERAFMETLCRLAEWPVALRADSFDGRRSAFSARDVVRYTRGALDFAARLLARGETLVVFPQGYPTIDPAPSRPSTTTFLPFRPGVVAIARRAQRLLGRTIPVVPAGFAYEPPDRRPQVTLRFGEPLALGASGTRDASLAELERRVRELSR